MRRYDFAIVGYGPTGATLANLLCRLGYRIVVIDQAREIYPKPRAITADHEALRAFQACGLAETIAAGAIPHPGTDYLGTRGQLIKKFYPMASTPPLAWEPTFMFVQPELEAVLREGIQDDPLAVFRLGLALARFSPSEEGVTLVLEDGSELEAAWLLACDGGRSAVRRQLDVGIEDLAFDENWIVIDAHLRGDTALPARCVQYCRPERPGTYIVGPGPLRRWEIKMLPGETPEDFQTEAALRKVLRTFVDDTGLEIVRTAIYRFHALVARRWRSGRVFLLGDAAHQMPPFMGQGLCAGVRDAFNLAWKLDKVMRHGADDALLDSYEAERKPHAKAVVAHAKRFGLIIGELDREAAERRDAALEAELASGQAETVRQRFIPDLEQGLIDLDAAGRPQGGAGGLFVQPWVRAAEGEWRRLDDVVGFDFLIVVTDAQVLQTLPEALLSQWRHRQGSLVTIGAGGLAERDGLFAQWMQRHRARAVVVRPDRYVYGSAADGAALSELMSRLLHGVWQPSLTLE